MGYDKRDFTFLSGGFVDSIFIAFNNGIIIRRSSKYSLPFISQHQSFGQGSKDIKGSGLERAAKYLKDVVGIDGFTADKQWEYITVIRDARNMVVHNGGRIYKEFDKYDKFKIGYREEDHQLYLEYNDIVKMYDAILDFMDRTFRIIP